jgi:hypothetical protein
VFFNLGSAKKFSDIEQEQNSYRLKQWKLFNVITFGLRETDIINQTISMNVKQIRP